MGSKPRISHFQFSFIFSHFTTEIQAAPKLQLNKLFFRKLRLVVKTSGEDCFEYLYGAGLF